MKIGLDSTLRKRKISIEGIKLTLLALPFVIFVFVFCYLPLFGWSFAFFDYKPGLSLSQAEYVGLKYFKYIFSYNKDMIRVLKNTLAMSFMSLATSVLPVIFAILLNELRNLRFKKFIQSFVTLPHFISWVIAYSLCFAIFSTNGMYNNLMQVLNITDKPNTVLSNSNYVWTFMTTLDIWKGLGWGTIIYLAAIAGIDAELYEAAIIDGAGRFRCIWHITVPNLMETYIVLLLLSVGNLLSIGLDKYLNFKNPLNASKIEALDLYIYRIGLMTHDYSFATAIGIAKSLVSIVLLFTVNKLARKVRGESII
ncbi:MAG TPA: ABC transporter permease subunit [Clostridiales bacterium]|nr:ABC transporter permease subunit [Clostridiales bacterium]